MIFKFAENSRNLQEKEIALTQSRLNVVGAGEVLISEAAGRALKRLP